VIVVSILSYTSDVRIRKHIGIIGVIATAAFGLFGALDSADMLGWPRGRKLILSSIVVSLAAWVAFAAAIGLDRPRWRKPTIATLVGLALLVGVYLADVWLFMGGGGGGELWDSAFLVVLPSVGAAALLDLPRWRTAGIAILVGLAFAAFLSWLGYWFAQAAGWRVESFFEAAWAAALGPILFGCGRVRRGERLAVRNATAIIGGWLALVAMAASLLGIFDPEQVWRGFPPFIEVITSLWLIATAACVPHALLAIRASGPMVFFRNLAIGLCALACLGTLSGVMGWRGLELVLPCLNGFVGALLAMGGIAWIRHANHQWAKPKEAVVLSIVCPRCQQPSSLLPGASECSVCRLRFAILVEEPRCAGCGQWIQATQSDCCSECGRSIRESGRGEGSVVNPSR
jgi:hypothetical protein